MRREPGYYWIREVDKGWQIAYWSPYHTEGHGSFWTCGDETDIEINDDWTYERRGIVEIDEKKIVRQ